MDINGLNINSGDISALIYIAINGYEIESPTMLFNNVELHNNCELKIKAKDNSIFKIECHKIKNGD